MYLSIKVSDFFLFVFIFPGKENEGNGVVFSRFDVFAAAPYENSPLPLAAERTRRKDPLDGFNKYISGWNISDRHYWAVTSFNPYSLICSVFVN